MNTINEFNVLPISMITAENKQKIDMHYISDFDGYAYLNVFEDDKILYKGIKLAIRSGKSKTSLFLDPPKTDTTAKWQLVSKENEILAQAVSIWKKPREWTFYVMVSSHTDIGLHNSQYIQRHSSEKFIDMALELCDKTDMRPDESRYRYVMEGTWFWNNYPSDRGVGEARKIVDNYINKGKLGICGGIAGNHTQVYGMEELCRSTYGRRKLETDWGIKTKTLSMIDNNGLSWSIVEPYAKAGFENIIFAPNQWNPFPPTVSRADTYTESWIWNPNAGGGAARIDVRYDSRLPMVFYWRAKNQKDKLLVWCSTLYSHGGIPFGMYPEHRNNYGYEAVMNMEDRFSNMLGLLEKKYSFNIWLLANYTDDQEPSLNFCDIITKWNKKWKWPQIRMTGNIDEPFDIIRRNFDSEIPSLSGEITGGWYQHPLSAPDLLADKFEADRALPTAEKLSSVAAIIDSDFKYPKEEFNNAWEGLLFNDEHSYGTSGYSGRRVFETWIQHRDWIEKAKNTADKYISSAAKAITSHISSTEDCVVAFNPTLYRRSEIIDFNGMKAMACDIPPFGYKTIPLSEIANQTACEKCDTVPVVESEYYKLVFAENGSIKSIYDKEINKELLNESSRYNANEFLYTRDNHKTYTVPGKAQFEIRENDYEVAVISRVNDNASGAEIISEVKLLKKDKKIEIDNKINHIRDMFNKNRFYRYAYYAFPFRVENAKRYCNINGSVAEYGVDLTGHSTDTYMSANEWCCVENNDFGIALIQADSHIVEFDKIHPDKTDYGDIGDGSELYVYLANDWLQMYVSDGEQLNFNFRYVITSYKNGYEKARIPQMAELFVNPVVTCINNAHSGSLNSKEYSFLNASKELRLLTLKAAEDKNGLIARFFGDAKDFEFSLNVGKKQETKPCGIDEGESVYGDGSFFAYRICGDGISIAEAEKKEKEYLTIGEAYTGLITKPRASCGENGGQMYLLWGQNTEGDLSHYELYRSEDENFIADESTFAEKVEPGEYRVARYEDLGLKEHTKYYYKVRAVNTKGVKGPFSDVFCGLTRLSLD